MCDFEQYTDEELALSYKNGNEKAFSELYTRYEKKLKRLIYYYIPNTDDANDVFHDTLMRVYRHFSSFNVKRSFSSWVYQIAINCSKNYIAKNKRNILLMEREVFRLREEYQNQVSPEDIYISKNDMDEFNRSIENLKDKFRSVFILRHVHGLKYSDISKILKCSERTAKWRMEKAILEIARYLSSRDVI